MQLALKTRFFWALPIMFVGVLIDQLSKVWAIGFLKGGPRFVFLDDMVQIYYAENRGAFLGLGSGLSPELRFWLLTVLVGAFLIGLLVYLFIAKEMDKLTLAALSLIFTGGFSNFIDRALNEGAVVDFLNVGIGSLRTGIFNIADMYIMAGAGLIILAPVLLKKSTSTESK